MTKAFVSVLIDTYNHERFIEQAIRSVLGQDFPASDREVIVVDDGSTDRTAEIAGKFEPHVRLIRKSNSGQASAFNAGIAECTGEMVAFLDGDDWWAAGKLAAVRKAMQADASIGIVGHGIVTVHQDGTQQEDALNENHIFQANTLGGARLFRLRKSFLGTSRMTIRSQLLQQIGKVPEVVKVQADEYLFTLAAALSRVQILREPLTFYRMHDANFFQMATSDAEKIGNKQRSLAALAINLREQLEIHGVSEEAQRAITEIVQAEADQIRLMHTGGSGREVMKNEWTLYKTSFPEASMINKMVKLGSLVPAIFLPAKTFYSIRKKIVKNRLYAGVRKRWMPAARLPHVDTNWKTGS